MQIQPCLHQPLQKGQGWRLFSWVVTMYGPLGVSVKHTALGTCLSAVTPHAMRHGAVGQASKQSSSGCISPCHGPCPIPPQGTKSLSPGPKMELCSQGQLYVTCSIPRGLEQATRQQLSAEPWHHPAWSPPSQAASETRKKCT